MDSIPVAQANALPAAESVAARRAYSRRAHSEHPGVTVLALNRRGRTKIVLRYLDPRDGKRHQCERLTDSGEPWPYSESEKTSGELPAIFSREAAKTLARQLSDWLKLQRSVHELKAAGVAFDPSPVTPLIPFAGEQISWTELKTRHELKLAAQGCSYKTKETYASHWRHFMAWGGKPAWPSELREAHLQAFRAWLPSYRPTNGKIIRCVRSNATICDNVRVVLNFGRRIHRDEARTPNPRRCVTLDSESIRDGLAGARLPALQPVAFSQVKLRKILKAAARFEHKAIDAGHDRSIGVFAFLAFVMVTGVRRGEAERLRWRPSKPNAAESWVDFGGGAIVIFSGKTQTHRTIRLDTRPLLASLLKTMKRACDSKAEPFVFGGVGPLAIAYKRDDPLEGRGRSLKRALDDAKLESGLAYRIKDLRANLATWMAHSDLGRNMMDLAFEMGHDYRVLLRSYARRHFAVPIESARAKTVEELLGVSRVIKRWTRGLRKKLHPAVTTNRPKEPRLALVEDDSEAAPLHRAAS
jgi:integrase